MSIADLLRPQVAAYAAYRPSAIPPGITCLNANESAEPTNGEVLNRYPENRPSELGRRLAKLYDVEPEQLLVTRGSSDAIDLLIRAFCIDGQDNVVTTSPTFDMYAKYAQLQGAAVRQVMLQPERDFALDITEIITACSAETKLVFIGSPNNPTGSIVPIEDLRRLLNARQDQSIVVVDEAYIEFCSQPSATQLLADFENLVVLRTLSKAYATAGARCGSAIASQVVIEALDKMLPPYAMATPVVECVLRATTPESLAAANGAINAVCEQREVLAAALQDYDYVDTIWPSSANFLLVRVNNAARLHAHLLSNQLLVRDFPSGGELANCLRITIGTRDQQQRLLESLDRYEDPTHDA